MTDALGNIFLEFSKIDEKKLAVTELDAPLTHALIVVKCQGKYLFMYNKWRNSWELPGGVIKKGETAKQRVIRELFEETNQKIDYVDYKGLMKFRLQPSYHGLERTEYGVLYSGQLSQLDDFVENDEAKSIILWDGVSDIGTFSEIDKKLIEFI